MSGPIWSAWGMTTSGYGSEMAIATIILACAPDRGAGATAWATQGRRAHDHPGGRVPGSGAVPFDRVERQVGPAGDGAAGQVGRRPLGLFTAMGLVGAVCSRPAVCPRCPPGSGCGVQPGPDAGFCRPGLATPAGAVPAPVHAPESTAGASLTSRVRVSCKRSGLERGGACRRRGGEGGRNLPRAPLLGTAPGAPKPRHDMGVFVVVVPAVAGGR